MAHAHDYEALLGPSYQAGTPAGPIPAFDVLVRPLEGDGLLYARHLHHPEIATPLVALRRQVKIVLRNAYGPDNVTCVGVPAQWQRSWRFIFGQGAGDLSPMALHDLPCLAEAIRRTAMTPIPDQRAGLKTA